MHGLSHWLTIWLLCKHIITLWFGPCSLRGFQRWQSIDWSSYFIRTLRVVWRKRSMLILWLLWDSRGGVSGAVMLVYLPTWNDRILLEIKKVLFRCQLLLLNYWFLMVTLVIGDSVDIVVHKALSLEEVFPALFLFNLLLALVEILLLIILLLLHCYCVAILEFLQKSEQLLRPMKKLWNYLLPLDLLWVKVVGLRYIKMGSQIFFR